MTDILIVSGIAIALAALCIAVVFTVPPSVGRHRSDEPDPNDVGTYADLRAARIEEGGHMPPVTKVDVPIEEQEGER